MENWESPIAKSRPWNDFPLSCQRWTKEERDQRRRRRILKGTIATKFIEKKQNNRPCLKERRDDNRTMKPDPEPLLSRRNKDQGNFQRRITLRKTELPDLTKSKLKLNRPPLTGDNDDRTKGNFL